MFKYVCQNFKDGQVLTADCLNKMEEGIENACQTPGPQGEKGDDGVSVTHEWDGTTLKITSASGTSSADLRGPTGPIGIKGNPGDAGKSAYEYARDSGYMGSEVKFSEQLAGIPDWDKTENYTANTTIVISQQSLSSGMWMNRKQDIEPGIPYAVYIGGKEYFCIAGNEDGTIYLGNPKLFDSASTQAHNNEPFCITWAGGAATAGMFFKDSTLSYPITLKVTGAAVTMEKKLPVSYLPDDVALKSDIPEGGSGANIDVVASVGQTIVVEEVDADGKPTKWKAADYQERTHWKEEGQEDIVPELTFTPILNSSMGVYQHPLAPFELVEGKTYTVIFDGVSYTCTAFASALDDSMTAVAIGNTALAGGANTGEPFALGVFDIGNSEVTLSRLYMVVCFDANEHTVKVIEDKIVPHKIPEEYVTPSVLYVSIGVRNAPTFDLALLTPWEHIIEAVKSGKIIHGRIAMDDYEFDQYGKPHTYYVVTNYICTEAKIGTNSLECSLTFMVTGSTDGTVRYLTIARDKDGVTTIPISGD